MFFLKVDLGIFKISTLSFINNFVCKYVHIVRLREYDVCWDDEYCFIVQWHHYYQYFGN